MVIKTLEEMEKKIPRKVIPMDHRLLFDVGNLYYTSGGMDQYVKIAWEIEKIALRRLEENPMDINGLYHPYRLLLDTYDKLKEYGKAIDILIRLQSIMPNNEQVKLLLTKYRNLASIDTLEVPSQTIDIDSQ